MENPDHIITHPIDGKCPHCQAGHKHIKIVGEENRQVFDLPTELRMEVTEHRREVGECQCCGKKIKASYPEEIKAPVQYGERTHAYVLYLQSYQLLPCERLSELMRDVWNCQMSTGTISKMFTEGGKRAEPVTDEIKAAVRGGPFLHSDETGLSVNGKLHWLHTASTPTLTWLHVGHEIKRQSFYKENSCIKHENLKKQNHNPLNASVLTEFWRRCVNLSACNTPQKGASSSAPSLRQKSRQTQTPPIKNLLAGVQ